MQTITIKTAANININPEAYKLRAIEERQAEAEKKPTRYEKLPLKMRKLVNRVIDRSSSERDVVAEIDSLLSGRTLTIADKNGDNLEQWQGYSKIADIAVEEFAKRQVVHH